MTGVLQCLAFLWIVVVMPLGVLYTFGMLLELFIEEVLL